MYLALKTLKQLLKSRDTEPLIYPLYMYFLAGDLKMDRSSLLQAIQSAVTQRAHLPQQDVCETEKILVDCPPALPHLPSG